MRYTDEDLRELIEKLKNDESWEKDPETRKRAAEARTERIRRETGTRSTKKRRMRPSTTRSISTGRSRTSERKRKG